MPISMDTETLSADKRSADGGVMSPPRDVLALVTSIDGGEGQLIEKLDRITRLEVIEPGGRVYVRGSQLPVKLKASLQDDGRTLKIFVSF